MTLGDFGLNLPLVRQESEVEGNYGLVVDGASLQLLLERLKDEFYAVCRRCIAVTCCRMSPKQKAEVGFFLGFYSFVIEKSQSRGTTAKGLSLLIPLLFVQLV